MRSKEDVLYEHWGQWANEHFKDVDTSPQSFNDNFDHSFVLKAMEEYADIKSKEKYIEGIDACIELVEGVRLPENGFTTLEDFKKIISIKLEKLKKTLP